MEYPDGFPLLPHFSFTHPVLSVCVEFWHSPWNESILYDIYNKEISENKHLPHSAEQLQNMEKEKKQEMKMLLL